MSERIQLFFPLKIKKIRLYINISVFPPPTTNVTYCAIITSKQALKCSE